MATRTRATANGNETQAVTRSCPILDELGAAFRHVSIGMAIGTVDDHLIDVNPAFCRMLGYSRDELLALGFDGINHPEDRGVDPVRWSSLAAGDRDSYQREKRYLRKDGSLLWVQITVSALHDDGGQFIGGLAQFQDITAQKAAETALRENETRLASLVGQLPIALYTLDPDEGGAFGFVSPQFAGLTGFTPGGDAGTFAERLALVHPDNRDFVRATNERCDRSGESMEIEYRLRGVNGEWVWVYNQAILTRDEDGAPLAWHGVVLDVSARKRLEASLRESEQRFRRAFADAGTGMSLCTPDWIILDANDAYCRLVGLPRDAVVGRSIAAFTHPEDLAAGSAEHARLVAGEVDAYQIEKRYVRPDSTVVTGLLTVSAVRDETGAFLYDIGQTQDVTAQKAAEAALRENETRLRELVNQLPAALYRQDAPGDGTATYVGPSLATMLGIDRADLPLGFAAFVARMHPDDRAAAEEAAARAERTGEAMDVEYRLQRADGDWIWIHDRSVLERDAHGQPQAWTGVLLDISERKRLEAALSESQEQFRRAFADAPIGMVLATQDNVCLDANAAYCRLVGLPRDELIGRSFVTVTHPDDVATEAGLMARLRAGELDTYQAEKRYMRPDGEVVTALVSASAIRDESGALRYAIGQALDISAQKAAEAALRESEAHLRTIVEQLPAALYSLEPGDNGRYLFASPRFAELTGLEMNGQGIDLEAAIARIHPDDVQAVRDGDATASVTGEPLDLQYRVLGKDGKWRWVHDRSALARDERGESKGWYGILLDISEQKRIAQALQENEAHLQMLVDHLSVAFYSVEPDPGGKFTYVSPQFSALTGLELEDLTEGIFTFFDRAHPEDIPAIYEADRRADETGEPCELEFRIRNAADDWIWVFARSVLTRDELGRPLAWHCMMVDVSEHKRLEAALRDNAARQQLLADSLSVAFYSQDAAPGTPFTYVSSRYADLTGLDPDGLTGSGLEGFFARIHPDDVAAVQAADRRADETGEPFEIEFRIRNADDDWIWVHNRGLLARDEQGRPSAWHGVLLDVGERKRLEAALREQAAHMEILVEQLPVAVYSLEPRMDGRFTFVSPQFATLTGMTAEDMKRGLPAFYERVHPDDYPALRAEAERATATGEPFEIEYRVRNGDDEWLWLLNRANLLRDEQGRPVAWHGVFLDVSERHALESSLRDSEERFRRAFDGAGIGMALTDPRGPIFDVNRSLCDFLGYTRDELRSMTFLDITHPDDVDLSLDWVGGLTRGEFDAYSLEKRYVRKDGQTAWGLLTSTAVRAADGRVLNVIAQIQDITARKQAEEALRHSEERFRRAFEDAGIGMTLADPRGPIIDANPAFCRFIGRGRDELKGMSFLDITHPDDRAVSTPYIERLLAGEINGYALDKRYIHADGHTVWGHLTTATVRSADDQPLYSISQIQDITARKDAEAALRDSEARFRSIFEGAGIGMALASPQGTILLANPALERLLGYALGELAGVSVDAITHYEDLSTQEEQWRRMRNGESDSYVMEKRYLRRDGGFVWALVDVSAVRDDSGALTATIAQVQDVTARKEAQAALASREALFRSIFEEAGIGMSLVSREGIILLANRALGRILDYEPEELAGMAIDDLSYAIDPVRQAAFRQRMRSGEIDSYTIEKHYLRKDGGHIWALVDSTAIRDERGRMTATIGQVQDITARREAEEALRESEARFRSIFAGAGIGMALVDPAGVIMVANPALERLLGYEPDALEGVRIDALTFPEDVPVQAEQRRLMLAGETDAYQFEKRYLRADGAIVWGLLTGVAVRDERGDLVAVIGQVQDITARREAEAALRGSEARLRSIFEGAAVGMTLSAPDGTILLANPALEHLLGYAPGAMEGVRSEAITVPEDLPLQLEYRRRLLAGEIDTYQFEKRFLRRDGGIVWTLLAVTGIRDDRGALTAVIAQVQDVTARKEAEAALRESEARFRALVDNDPDVIAIIDDTGMLNYLSPSAHAALGVSAAELLGPVEPLLRYLHPDDVEQVLALYGEVGARTGAAAAAEARIKHRTLGWRWFVITMANQIDYPGINGYLFNLRDITERKEAELATAAALRAQQTAIAELERLNRSKSRFLSTISHEFRTPLTAIIGFSELLASDATDTATVAEDAAVIHREASRLNRMVDDVLLVERLDTGHMPLSPRPVNLNTIAEDVVETFRPLAGAHRFVLDLERRLRAIDGDPDRLAQALTNLVGNAVKYSPTGGMVTIATRDDGDDVVISVRDEGIGIAPDDLSRIFDRFERVETGTAGRIPGTGLGLYIVREIVNLHQGRLRVESVPNDGATFSLTFPARVRRKSLQDGKTARRQETPDGQ